MSYMMARNLLSLFLPYRPANTWWRIEKAGRDVSSMTWLDFIQRFYAEYFLKSERDVLRAQFEGLKQRRMTIADYRAEFTRLERFTPGVCPDEAERARRFQEGLRRELYLPVTSNIYQRLSDAVEAAIVQERAQAQPDELVQAQPGKRRSDQTGDRA